jgi:hypothetical protein
MWKATRSIDRARRLDGATSALRSALGAFVLVVCGSAACVPAEPLPPEVPPSPAANSPPVEFGYATTNGGQLTSTELRGRFAVLAFVATYDLASQAQIKVLGLVQRNHAPRVNVAAIALEPPENAPLVAAFADGLRVPFPVALADARTLAGHGPFEGLRHVPSIVILDRDGREVYRHLGAMDEKPLRAELERLGARR